jgi:hypothetical protein
MPKSKLSALLSLLLVFASGVLVGVVGYRLYTVNTVASRNAVRPRPDPEEVRKRIVAEMRSRLKLDDQQVGELNKIYDQTRQDFDELHQKLNSESHALWEKQTESITAILRPDQRPLFNQFRAEREQERKRRHAQGEGPGRGMRPGPPPGPPPEATPPAKP